jgi:hypothetical protein
MTEAEAFAAIALAAVACDGVLGREEAHALRKQLEFRFPYRERSESDMGALFDQLLGLLRSEGVDGLLKQALPALSPLQQETALALASQLVHADRQVSSEEDAFLKDLTSRLNISEDKAKMIVYSISALNRDSLVC